jgi:hypothetical protein
MTREQFLSGTIFTVGRPKYKGASTFYYSEGSIMRQSRSAKDERVILEGYECNVTEIGSKGFKGFTYVMEKLVKLNYRFDDLVEFVQEA